MTPSILTDYNRLCIHTITNKAWSIEEAAKKYSQAGLGGITVWRQTIEGKNPAAVGKMIREEGLQIVSLCRGGFFVAEDEKGTQAAIDDNKRIIDQAAALGAPLIVLVCGAKPGIPLIEARKQISEGISRVLGHADECGVKLAIEPLHPMYADERSAINTMAQASAICREHKHPCLGIALDVYHTWWDSQLRDEIQTAGKEGTLFAFHICDWKTPTIDLLNDRGLMGEGCIPIREIRGWVEEAGFHGFNEVEIFSNRYWSGDQDVFLDAILRAYLEHS